MSILEKLGLQPKENLGLQRGAAIAEDEFVITWKPEGKLSEHYISFGSNKSFAEKFRTVNIAQKNGNELFLGFDNSSSGVSTRLNKSNPTTVSMGVCNKRFAKLIVNFLRKPIDRKEKYRVKFEVEHESRDGVVLKVLNNG